MRPFSRLMHRAVSVALVAASFAISPGTAAADDKDTKDTILLTVEYEPFRLNATELHVFVTLRNINASSVEAELQERKTHQLSGYVDNKLKGKTKKTTATCLLPVPAGEMPSVWIEYGGAATAEGIPLSGVWTVDDLPIKPGAALHLVLGNGRNDSDTGDLIRPISSTYAYTELDKAVKTVEVKEQVVQAAEDSPQVKKEEYTIRHSVSVMEGWKKEIEAKGELKLNLSVVEATIGASVKAGIERSTSKAVEASQTSTREVTIPGNGKKYKVVWVETYRTGKAITIVDGKRYEIPFEYRDGWDLQTRLVKD